jgi:TolB-like protein/DNA-binding winged helix-turn-helix (wHTH) protein/Tfp pilus assembly protein PilF
MNDPGHTLRFDRFTLDTARGVLLGPWGEIPLRPKSYEVLLYLARHPGRLIARNELIDAVWGKAVITDDSLTQCLVEIRRALGDETRTLVRTVPRRGYRFDPPPAASEREDDPPVTRPDRRPGRRADSPHRRRALAIPALVLLGLALTWLGLGREGASPTPESAAPLATNAIAVLPFVDMSASGDQEYLGDGIAEEVLNTLAQSRDIKVIARTSSFAFKDRPVDIRTIAGQLGVSYVLEGSVRRSGNRIRVIAQLINARDGAHLWSEDFDRELTEIFAVQAEIADRVAEALHVYVSAAPGGPERRDITAYEQFLRGRFHYHRRAEGDLERSRRHFEAAVERDPGNAAAWAALAGAYMREFESDAPEKPGYEPARAAAARALALDPRSVEGHLRTALLLRVAGDERAWRRHMEIAEKLEPDNPLLLGLKGGAALQQNDRATAIALNQRVVQRDPLSPLHRINFAVVLLADGQLEEARAQALAVQELASRRPDVDLLLASVLILERRFDEAARLIERLPEEHELLRENERDVVLAIVTHALGQEAYYRKAMERLRSRDSADAATALARVYAQRGDLETAWQWIAEAQRRTPDGRADDFWLMELSSSAFLRPLHEDSRWAGLYEADPEQVVQER